MRRFKPNDAPTTIKRNGTPKNAGCFLRVAFILDVRVLGPSGRASNVGIGFTYGFKYGTVQETETDIGLKTPETTSLKHPSRITREHMGNDAKKGPAAKVAILHRAVWASVDSSCGPWYSSALGPIPFMSMSSTSSRAAMPGT